MKILFSEGEWYYRDLGLNDVDRYAFSFDGMRYYNKSDRFLYQYDLFVCSYYTMPHNVILTRRFHALGVKTILCSDGIFDFANSFKNPMHLKYGLTSFHPILQDVFLCVGKNEANYFNDKAITMDFMPKRLISRKVPCPIPEDKRVLLTTANTAYFNNQEYDVLLGLIIDIGTLLIEGSIDFSFRIFDKKLLASLNKEFGLDISNDIDEGFEDTLQRYSSVITTPSSIAVVSMFHRRSTALLIYRDWPMLLQTGWMVPSAKIFGIHLSDFLMRSESRMEVQDKFLDGYLTKNGMTERVLEAAQVEFKSVKERESLIIKSYENMLLSKFNFNFEFFIRKLYKRLRSFKILSSILNRIKKSVF